MINLFLTFFLAALVYFGVIMLAAGLSMVLWGGIFWCVFWLFTGTMAAMQTGLGLSSWSPFMLGCTFGFLFFLVRAVLTSSITVTRDNKL